MQLVVAQRMSQSATVELVRDASRRLVRELGFMRGTLAGTALSPSAVHALIEIDARGGTTASELAERLRLDKSSVSRMVRKLVAAGEALEGACAADGRAKPLSLSEQGRGTVAEIHRFARAQVADALARLTAGQQKTVVAGLRAYADALAGCDDTAAPIAIEIGYRPGLVARITELHASHYARVASFGQPFEAMVARGLAEFTGRLGNPVNAVWRATEDGQVVGAVAIDGEDLGPGSAHLRWFIVDDGWRGRGIGRDLLTAALGFCDRHGFAEIVLWTFRGLDAARHLYEAVGFELAEERPGRSWGPEVMEQRFVRPSPKGAAG